LAGSGGKEGSRGEIDSSMSDGIDCRYPGRARKARICTKRELFLLKRGFNTHQKNPKWRKSSEGATRGATRAGCKRWLQRRRTPGTVPSPRAAYVMLAGESQRLSATRDSTTRDTRTHERGRGRQQSPAPVKGSGSTLTRASTTYSQRSTRSHTHTHKRTHMLTVYSQHSTRSCARALSLALSRTSRARGTHTHTHIHTHTHTHTHTHACERQARARGHNDNVYHATGFRRQQTSQSYIAGGIFVRNETLGARVYTRRRRRRRKVYTCLY